MIPSDQLTQRVILKAAERAPAVAKVRRAVARALDGEQVLRPGEKVIVACSGGPDSMVLLDCLARLAAPRKLTLLVVNIDHQLRAESANDSAIVTKAAQGYDLDFVGINVVINQNGSLQDQARIARYKALSRVADEHRATVIATGHNADDQAETVLMRALAGATPKALSAMRMRRGMLARPLLRVWREQIEAYCQALDLTVIRDPSNENPRYLRSRVRQELIPHIEQIFPSARRRLVALAQHQQAIIDRMSTTS